MSEIQTAINKVMDAVGYVRKQRGKNINYTYAGERALISAIRPEMVENGLFMVPHNVVSHSLTEYTTSRGSVMQHAVVVVHYRMHHTSGEYLDIMATGEGADVGDKSFNKAMTGAYKYALRQTFCIETGDDPDATPSQGKAGAQKPKAPATNGNGRAKVTADQLKALHAAGHAVYGPIWDSKRGELVDYVTEGRTKSSKELYADEAAKIIKGINAKANGATA